jgi:uncharacterized damage-inducible protein DinB
MNPYLPKSIELGPKAITRLLSLIPEERFDERLDPDRFTIREVLAHMADWEPILRERMMRIKREPGSNIQAFDEEQMAIDNDYASQDVRANLDNWIEQRGETARFIRGLTEADMATQALHPSGVTMSLGDVANMMIGHDLYHVEQISEYLA